MKPQDRKHPGRDKWHILEQWNTWYEFKAHTVHLDDDNMRDRILIVIDATTEIRYHRSCWRKYVIPEYNPAHDEDELHLQNVRLTEFEPNTKSNTITSMLEREFQDTIGFHIRYHKNDSSLVYDTAGGGSYIEAAINSWGITDKHRIKESVSRETPMYWPPHIDSLEKDEESNQLLSKFLTWLKNSRATDIDELNKDPSIKVLSSLLMSFVTSKRTPFKVNLSVLIHGLTRSREIIDLMKKFSLGVSYADVLALYDTWAQYDIEENQVYPEKLAVGMPCTGIMDNDDFKDDTLTGESTLHRTNVKFVQPEDVAKLPTDSRLNVSVADPRNVKRLCMEQHKIYPTKQLSVAHQQLEPRVMSPCLIP